MSPVTKDEWLDALGGINTTVYLVILGNVTGLILNLQAINWITNGVGFITALILTILIKRVKTKKPVTSAEKPAVSARKE